MREQLKNWSLRIFTLGTVLMLLCGMVAAVLYLLAFLLGGRIAEMLTALVTGRLFPVWYVLNILFCVSGLVHVYLIHDKGFRFEIARDREQ